MPDEPMDDDAVPASELSGPTRTDWARVDAFSEDEIDTSDIPPLTEDILRWFQAQGQDYPQRMRAALRLYAEAHRAAAL